MKLSRITRLLALVFVVFAASHHLALADDDENCCGGETVGEGQECCRGTPYGDVLINPSVDVCCIGSQHNSVITPDGCSPSEVDANCDCPHCYKTAEDCSSPRYLDDSLCECVCEPSTELGPCEIWDAEMCEVRNLQLANGVEGSVYDIDPTPKDGIYFIDDDVSITGTAPPAPPPICYEGGSTQWVLKAPSAEAPNPVWEWTGSIKDGSPANGQSVELDTSTKSDEDGDKELSYTSTAVYTTPDGMVEVTQVAQGTASLTVSDKKIEPDDGQEGAHVTDEDKPAFAVGTKEGGYATFKAVTDLSDEDFAAQLEWGSEGEEVTGSPKKRKVKLDSAAKTVLTLKKKGTTTVEAQLAVWVISAELTDFNNNHKLDQDCTIIGPTVVVGAKGPYPAVGAVMQFTLHPTGVYKLKGIEYDIKRTRESAAWAEYGVAGWALFQSSAAGTDDDADNTDEDLDPSDKDHIYSSDAPQPGPVSPDSYTGFVQRANFKEWVQFSEKDKNTWKDISPKYDWSAAVKTKSVGTSPGKKWRMDQTGNAFDNFIDNTTKGNPVSNSTSPDTPPSAPVTPPPTPPTPPTP